MKQIAIAIVLFFALSPFVDGQSKRNSTKPNTAEMYMCNALPWDSHRTDWDIGQNLPAGLKKEELVKLLHPAPVVPDTYDAKGEVLIGVGAKAWKYLPDTYLVIVETDTRVPNNVGGTESTGRFFSLAAVKHAAGSPTFTVVATTKEPIKYENSFQFNKYDLAPYKLNESEYAFGMRRCVVDTGTGFTNSYESLDLFRISGDKIEKILSTAMGYQNAPLRGGKETIEKASISVVPGKTNGYFNLTKTAGKAKPAVFRWDGTSYQTKDKDPFKTFADPNARLF